MIPARLTFLGPVNDVMHVAVNDFGGAPLGCALMPHQSWLHAKNLAVSFEVLPCRHEAWVRRTSSEMAELGRVEMSAPAPERAT